MISKELLDKIIEHEARPMYELNGVLYYMKSEFQSTEIGYMPIQRNINIYELAHKCKIWAARQNFKIDDELSYGIEKGRAKLEQYQEFDMYDVFGYKIGRNSKSDWFNADSVPEAIFKACEWILQNDKT